MYAAALCLDGPTLANLELLEGSNGEAEGSLLAALDTCTSPGNLSPPPPPALVEVGVEVGVGVGVGARIGIGHCPLRQKPSVLLLCVGICKPGPSLSACAGCKEA